MHVAGPRTECEALAAVLGRDLPGPGGRRHARVRLSIHPTPHPPPGADRPERETP